MDQSNGKRCQRCETDISHLSYKHRYCEGCKKFRYRVKPGTMRSRACQYCGNTFEYTVSQGSDRRYCSSQCSVSNRVSKQQFRADSMPRCTVDGCDTKSRSRSSPYCERHYGMVRRNGAPVLKTKLPPARVKFVQTGSCPTCERPLQAHSKKGTIYCSGDCRRLADRARRYGLTAQELKDLHEQQNNLCAICGSDERLVVDHSHRDGRARGLLCGSCNAGLGFLQDDPDILIRAADYLRTHDGRRLQLAQPPESGAASA